VLEYCRERGWGSGQRNEEQGKRLKDKGRAEHNAERMGQSAGRKLRVSPLAGLFVEPVKFVF